jgi:error-prone DNA polymerase
VFERQRRLVLTASMIACHGKVQKESGVIHVITDRFTDLSGLLREVGERDEPVLLPTGRGDEARHGGSPDPREKNWARPRDIYCPERLSTGLRVATRDFR